MKPSQFRRIGIVTRPHTPELGETLCELVSFFLTNGLEVLLDEECGSGLLSADLAPCCHRVGKENMGERCDLVLVLGGDGTFLSVARQLAPHRIPLMGVHLGHLGFLTQVPRQSMIEDISRMLAGQYLPEERIMLECSVQRDNEPGSTLLALNEVAISRGGVGQMIEFEVFINQEFVYTQRSDGLIVSTPTGSTAYALAAGGPILQSTLRALTLVPICPQSMTNRPVVVPDSCEIEILITKADSARVHFDGQSHLDLHSMNRLTIRRYRNTLRVLHPTDYQYYKTLRQKLHWGEQLV
ncbi:NAD(+) kinase [Eikenella longinqua]|uniref:NAD kinase n=1 Tax=Eikenella longinqua TaxID=1795827 RepID=A0A1A9RUW8_9NEIS|nr:NAD(+)/NADH kinase [Eikenella longinqua]OAM26103.1 NAD(+) kinase [Eikenella longinqua]